MTEPTPAGEATGFASFFVLIPAAGSGVRLGAPLPKQYLEIAGRAVLAHTVAVFDALDECRGIVIATDDPARVATLLDAHPTRRPVRIVDGGATRQESVARALAALPAEAGDNDVVLVHDAARPCVTTAHVRAVAAAIAEHGAALLALTARDTIKTGSAGIVEGTLDRRTIHLAQTPQGARAALLRTSFERASADGFDGTDEASLLEHAGIAVHLVEGAPSNLKITTPDDLVMAAAVLAARAASDETHTPHTTSDETPRTLTPGDGRLVIVGTPIGHPDDLSPRAAAALRAADLVVCEERKQAGRILRRLNLRRDLLELNEHTERAATEDALDALRSGACVALVSDCGMPVFADPGTALVRAALDENIAVDVVPGPTSLTTALAVAGIDVRRFHYHGFLSPKRDERARELARLRSLDIPLVLMDAPYRLQALLDDLARHVGARRLASVACDLTLPSQLVRRGTLDELANWFRGRPGKREFVIIIDRR
jgi:16S rRNA (cytidine(1402)-2'-O)-methyltransferase